MKKIIFVILSLCFSSGAFSHYQSLDEAIRRINENYDPSIKIFEQDSISNKKCTTNRVKIYGQDPIKTDNKYRELTLKVYTNQNWVSNDFQGNSRTIIILPTIIGVSELEYTYARRWCHNYPFKVVVMEKVGLDLGDPLLPSHHENGIIAGMAAIRHILEYLGEERVGIIGSSQGAILSSMALGLDERLTAGTLIVGGANLHEVIGKSMVPSLAYLRWRRMVQMKFDKQEEYIKYLDKNMAIDPLSFAQKLKQKKVFFVLSKKDVMVPTKNQKQFRDAIEPATYIEFNKLHVQTALHFANYYWKKVARFFIKNI